MGRTSISALVAAGAARVNRCGQTTWLFAPVIAALLAALSCGVFTPSARAQGSVPHAVHPPIPAGLLEDERNTIEIFRKVSPSVAFITNKQLRRDFFSRNVFETPAGSGSGFVWDTAGHIVTNFHVIQNGNSFTVTLADGTTAEAKVVGVEPNKDLAVLKIESSTEALQPLQAGDSDHLIVGQKVLAVGNPFGLDQTLTTGIISALGREIQSVAGTLIEDVIQTDASINPGNSGGPLLDSAGRLIGINTAIISPSGSSAGIGFAVPVDVIKRVVPQLIEFGKIKRAGLGISLIRDDLARRWRISGVIVRSVVEGGPADRAGIRSLEADRSGRATSFDVIVGVDGTKVEKYDDLYRALDQREPGDEVEVRYRRGDREHKARVRLMELE